MVFVLDKHKKPLMPCTPKKARLLLARGRAVVHRLSPFVIRLKDRLVEESVLQPVALKFDPGSRTTGIALARVEITDEGEVHHAVHLAELHHRGEAVHKAMVGRALFRRRRRSARLRYRKARFDNRTRPKGWLPPSVLSRVLNVLVWASRYRRWVPVRRIDVERVKFDTMLMHNPEVAGVEYQRGELAGWETRAYLLEKFRRRCAYCGREQVPFELDHIRPRSRGGSDRVSNLCLACRDCNAAKGNRTAREFGHPEVEVRAKAPLKDAAAMNATRFALVERLCSLNLPISAWSGGRTRWNRARFGIGKTHSLDALCVGNLAGVDAGTLRTLRISATGRGQYRRTLLNEHGFPRGYLMRQKRVHGIQTGDIVLAAVPPPYKAHGVHRGRVAVRRSGFFSVNGVDAIPARCCRVLQRCDGYSYTLNN
jgi:5-methylcytosine-specific restriction endonuclease McrA